MNIIDKEIILQYNRTIADNTGEHDIVRKSIEKYLICISDRLIADYNLYKRRSESKIYLNSIEHIAIHLKFVLEKGEAFTEEDISNFEVLNKYTLTKNRQVKRVYIYTIILITGYILFYLYKQLV